MTHPQLEIRVDTIDGAARLWVQHDSELARRTVEEIEPRLIFAQDQFTLSDGDTETTMLLSLINRIDLVTDHWSVWDFPFVLGALTEVTEGEFMQGLAGLQVWRRPATQNELPVYLDVEMVNDQRVFLQMQVVGASAAARLEKVYSLLENSCLIFGLRAGGIGVLNVSNVVRFAVHPEPPQTTPLAAALALLNRLEGDGAI